MVQNSDKLHENGRDGQLKRTVPGKSTSSGSRKSRKQRRSDSSPGRLLKKLLLCLAVLCVLTWIVSGGSNDGTSDEYSGREAVEAPEDDEMPDWITQQFLPVNAYSRPGIALEQVNGIVVHYVANPGSTGWENWHYFEGLSESHERKAGAHFIIGLDGTIIQCVPLDELTYCSNSRNVDTISIECCHPGEDGKFTDEAYDSLVKLCRWLLDYYHLDKDDVIRHYDVTGKLCPLYFVEHEDAWEAFKDELK
ncbi:MAG: peptidoglycan recognition family protein [Lachnospiraceae bacterium]|nr:peptidoglycan recognition family protein [Lachnospiraceae bacterium]MDY4970929.1 peptidoglycan recognition family protein [Lachnospiraceae bacterium]